MDPTAHDYNTDADVLRWARGKVQREVDRFDAWARQATDNGDAEQAEQWRMMANMLRRRFIGGKGCCIAAFDERKPELARVIAPTRIR
jgi:hypothetical protein